MSSFQKAASVPITLPVAQLQELEEVQHQLAKASQQLKHSESQKRCLSYLQKDHENIQRILQLREKFIEELESTVIAQKEIIAEQLEQLNQY